MGEIFLKIVNMSIAASWLIVAVVLLRILLKKAPKWINCVLWSLVAIRLVCPFFPESNLSLVPNIISDGTIVKQWTDKWISEPYCVYEGNGYASDASNEMNVISDAELISTDNKSLHIIDENGYGEYILQETIGSTVVPVLSYVWISVTVALLFYALFSSIKLKKSVAASAKVRDNILVCDEAKSPFILGIFKPVIYIPSSLTGETLESVLTHETAHIKRHDHWWKPLGYLLLTVYWFNPLCWLAYILLCRDIEMACDEKVIRDMDNSAKAAYSQALLNCSFPRKRIAACPLAFGEVGVKERVKSVLNYKKPAFWIIAVAVVSCIVVGVCFMTNPYSDRSISGKLGVSMDMAVAEYNHSSHSDGNFIATDYDVLRITKVKGKTTVYAWIYYAEYSFDGTDVKMESASHIPTVITFDTSSDGGDSSTYDVIEYWEPRDGSYYAEDIRDKFPLSIQLKAFDTSGAIKQKEKCLRSAKEYYQVSDSAPIKETNSDATGIFQDVHFLGEISDSDESNYQIGVSIQGTDFSLIGTELSEMIARDWAKYDSMTQEEKMISSHAPGLVSLGFDNWNDCENALGFSITNPLESLDWLTRTGYFGDESSNPSMPVQFIHVNANSAQIDRQLTDIHIDSGYRTENVHVTLNATLFAEAGEHTMGSAYNGYATFEHNTASTGSGIPVLTVVTNGTNNKSYYNESIYDVIAYWVQENVFYTLRVYGDKEYKDEVMATLERILLEI